MTEVRVAVLGPGGVGGLLAGALSHAGEPVTIVARESTAAVLNTQGLSVQSVRLGSFQTHPRAVARLEEPCEVLVVATKAVGLREALERVAQAPTPGIVVPLLNGLDHLALLRARFGEERVVAGSIRVESDRSQPGVVVHSSPFLRVDLASRFDSARAPMEAFAERLEAAGIPARVYEEASARAEALVMWSKLVRLNALACTTSAYDRLLGEILATPELRDELVGAIEEGCAVAAAEGAAIDAGDPLDELVRAHPTLGSSMQRDIAAGRVPELDAIAGAVLRAGARHGIACPTIERLVEQIAARAGVPAPAANAR